MTDIVQQIEDALATARDDEAEFIAAQGAPPPANIWLVYTGSGETVWCETPDPEDAGEPSVHYVRGAARDALVAEVKRLREAFLETREMLGLAEQVICEETCPTTWRTCEPQPHCKLHEDIVAVLAKHEAVRDAARAALEPQP